VLRGDRLTVDMTTGVSRVESDGRGVQALFIQGADCGGSAKPGGAPAPALPSLIPGKQK
jgi:lipopolysaccharide export system protein LptA